MVAEYCMMRRDAEEHNKLVLSQRVLDVIEADCQCAIQHTTLRTVPAVPLFQIIIWAVRTSDIL